jgi:type I restriction enzyme R subunit
MDAETGGISKSINELRTRKELIDPVLRRMGWIDKYIKQEVNSIKSDFNQKHFVFLTYRKV